MRTFPGSFTRHVRSARRQTHWRRRTMRRHLFRTAQVVARRAEATFWRQIEEREFGRLALEADHLFDTSYT
jgi:hypothetical protein